MQGRRMLLKPLQTLSAWFQSLERRERALLSLALWLLLPLVVLLAWFEPMMQSRQRLHERLERLDRERATMQALAQQWRSLDEQAPTVKRQDLETRIRASLKAAGGLDDFTIKSLDNGSVLLEMASAPQSMLMTWMVEVRRETQTQWAEFRIERSAQPEHLKLRIRFVEAGGKSS